MKNLTLWLLCLQTQFCLQLSGSFNDFLNIKADMRSDQTARTQRRVSQDDEIVFVDKRVGHITLADDDDNDDNARLAKTNKSKKKSSTKSSAAEESASSTSSPLFGHLPEESGSTASTGIFGDDDVVYGGQQGNHDEASGQSIADSVDLSISTITQKARENKKLSPQELRDIALAILKKQDKSGERRRSLSKKRLDADRKISSARETLHQAQQDYQQAVNNEEAVRQLETDAKGNQERIKNAMELLYSAIMDDPQIAEEIKEQWQDAKKPGGKISLWERAFSSCLLL